MGRCGSASFFLIEKVLVTLTVHEALLSSKMAPSFKSGHVVDTKASVRAYADVSSHAKFDPSVRS